ncbi:MAG: hypothetical protein RIA63_12945 [Cyclobacteriaceae bacterium]
MRVRLTTDALSNIGTLGNSGALYGVDSPPGRVKGDYYLDSRWNKGAILAYEVDKVIEGYLVKYDINGNSIEIKASKIHRLISVDRVQSIVWYDSLTSAPHAFVNAKEFKENGVPLTGLIEVVSDGKIPLMKRTTLYVKKPNYVVAMDVGSKDTEIMKLEKFYYAKGKDLFEVKKKKDLLVLFGDKGPEMDEFIKRNAINLRQEAGLKILFSHYNAQFKTEAY